MASALFCIVKIDDACICYLNFRLFTQNRSAMVGQKHVRSGQKQVSARYLAKVGLPLAINLTLFFLVALWDG